MAAFHGATLFEYPSPVALCFCPCVSRAVASVETNTTNEASTCLPRTTCREPPLREPQGSTSSPHFEVPRGRSRGPEPIERAGRTTECFVVQWGPEFFEIHASKTPKTTGVIPWYGVYFKNFSYITVANGSTGNNRLFRAVTIA